MIEKLQLLRKDLTILLQIILRPIDKVIDQVTMYRLLLYYLIGILVAAVALSLFKDIQYKPLDILVSSGILLVACFGINKAFSYIFDAPINPESSIITALILALIITPALTQQNVLFLLAASGLAMASKYLITYKNKHIFNPAAIAVALTAFGPKQSASWWVGTAVLLPFVLIGGVLIMRKIRRENMVISFFAATVFSTILYSVLSKANVMTSLHSLVFSSAVFFLGFVMLTEPLTSPVTKKKQAWYGAIVGFLLPPQVHILKFYTSPEIALIIGNAFAYIVSPKVKLFPALLEKVTVAKDTVDFVFDPGERINYKPGQYMEWTLEHFGTDSRGSRRYFTLASSPTEEDLIIGIKYYDKGSSFKHALLNSDRDTLIAASQLAGDFVMPEDPATKMVFIAGGIGITPFRSMVKYLMDSNDKRDVKLFYSARNEESFAYKDIFELARTNLGLQTIYTVSDTNVNTTSPYTTQGFITANLISQNVPDLHERVFYISGTHQMVESMHEILLGLGVKHRNIKIDFFPGYA
jgi:ferredoxin-NADP reductase/Na+-translocating ferredoxin:NAD+ oxidoreductase RnfD subunit